MKLEELMQAENLDPARILFYGFPGTGKTTFVLTAGADLELLDVDRGYQPGKTHKDQWSPRRLKAEIFSEPDDNVTVPRAFFKIKSKIYEIADQCARKTYPYKVVALDSLTKLCDAAMAYVRYNSGTYKLGVEGKNNSQPTQPEWGLAISAIEQVLAVFTALPVTTIVITHVLKESTEGGGSTERMHVFGAKLPNVLGGYFDEIWRANILKGGGAEGDKYVIQTQATPFMVARSRYGLPNNFEMNRGLPEALSVLGTPLVRITPAAPPAIQPAAPVVKT